MLALSIDLNSLHAGYFFMPFLRLLIFFKINFFVKLFQERYQSVKQFGSRSGPMFGGPELDPNCLQRLLAEDTSWQRVNCQVIQYCWHIN